jgi:transglutaminase-like putative cysteine protease
MAGLGDAVRLEINDQANGDQANGDQANGDQANGDQANGGQMSKPSLPLYAAGFVITLCGILAANAALTEPDYGWMTDTIMLSGLGFLFSYGSRRFGIAPRTLDFGFAAIAVILLACVASRQFNPVQLLPLGADQPNLRLLSALVWGGTFWSWALQSDNRVVGTTVPAMAVLGMAATIDVNTPVLVCFGVFILTVIFLLIHQNFLQNRSRAAGFPVSAPRRLLLAQLTQAGVCGLAVLLLGMLVIVPAQVVFSHLSLAQAIRHLAAIQTDPGNANAVQRFSDDDNLPIGTGDAWSSSPDVVMRVTPSDGQPHYWRGRTYDVYTGAGWQSSLENDQTHITVGNAVPAAAGDLVGYILQAGLTPGDLVPPADSPPLTTTYEVRGETNQFYYADTPHQIIFEAARDTSGLQTWLDGRLGLVDGNTVRFPYQVVSQAVPDLSQPGVADRLRVAGTDYPDRVRSLYLTQSRTAQPEDIEFYRQCIGEAFQALPPDRRDPLDEAAALRDWVSKRCIYTLTPPPLPDDSDHVHAFLGDTRRGYCDMFASSLAVLCRTAGIPARLAVGFAPGDPDGASFNLRAEDKHAWTEIYFPGTGWMAFDATSGTLTDGTVPNATSSHKASWLSRLHLSLNGQWQLVYPLVGIILAIAAYVAKTEIYDPWRAKRRVLSEPSAQARQNSRHDLAHPYARLIQSLAQLGLPRRPEETPGEYAARVLPQLSPLEREWNVSLPSPLVADLTAAFTEAVYGNPAAPLPPVQPWDSRVAAFDAAARRIARGRFWRRLLHQNPNKTLATDFNPWKP